MYFIKLCYDFSILFELSQLYNLFNKYNIYSYYMLIIIPYVIESYKLLTNKEKEENLYKILPPSNGLKFIFTYNSL